jgi:hypothetical protein
MNYPQDTNDATRVGRPLAEDFARWWERGAARYYAEKALAKDADAKVAPSSTDNPAQKRRAA